MKARGFAITLWLMLSPVLVNAEQPVPFVGHRVFTIMTRNVYDGVNAELSALLSAKNSEDLLKKVTAVYQGYFDRNFPERATALAAEIEATRPDLIGLQEAILVRRTQSSPEGSKSPATTVVLDYVQLLLDALAARGLQYEVVVQVSNLDAEFPSTLGFDVRHTDREVILARADLKAADLKFSNAQGGNFITHCGITSDPIGTIAFQRGWVAVDVKSWHQSFRLISTHLDAACPPAIRQVQAKELLDGPAVTQLPVVLVGDFNSPAGTSGESGKAYNGVITAGFTDAALHTNIENVPTCCQDDNLLNSQSKLNSRIDFIFFHGPFTVLSAEVVGGDPTDRTPSGLWPSDHAGVVATLELLHP